MRKTCGVLLGLAAGVTLLTAAPASAQCVTIGPHGDVIVYVGWPVQAVVWDPGPVTVNPTDCV